MKYFKSIALLIIAGIFTFTLNSCDEVTSTDGGPVIDEILPALGVPGDTVIIYGSNFGDDYNNQTTLVYFGDVKATNFVMDGNQVQWWDDEIQVYVPDNAVTGQVYVEVNGVKSNGINFTVPSVREPNNLMATSLNETTVGLKWTASLDEGDPNFLGYRLKVQDLDGNPVKEVELAKGVNTTQVNALNEGTIYDFIIQSKGDYNGTAVYSQPIKIKWSPATRFTKNINESEILMYEWASDFGSGLELYNVSGEGPKGLKVASGDDWDIGLYASGSTIEFGSAKNILDYSTTYNGTPKNCEISSSVYQVNSLDQVYDSEALDKTHMFSEQVIDLTKFETETNLVVVVRTKKGTAWHYAKVMIINKNGFLQGTSPNRYIEVQVSYQKGDDVPYSI